MVLESVRNYFYDRRRGLAKLAGFAGGVYLVGHYALQRLEETREKILQDRNARENIRRRFQQNQEDCAFTALALVPGLGNQILEELDVEGLTLQLQQYGTRNSQAQSAADLGSSTSTVDNIAPPPVSSEVVTPGEGDVPIHSPSHSASPISDGVEQQDFDTSTSTIMPIDTSQSWVKEFAAEQEQTSGQPISVTSPEMSLSSSIITTDEDGVVSDASITEGDGSHGELGESTFTHVGASEAAESLGYLSQSENFRRSPAPSPSPPPAPPKTKSELWKELKLTSFTRTLTILYSLVLLTLLTHVQLNILASHKYVQSIIEMESEEKQREQWGSVLGTGTPTGGFMEMFFGVGSTRGTFADPDDEDPDNRRDRGVLRISDITSRKFLTMSWWLLNVGWKAILDKVQAAVEEEFGPVALKAQLTTDTLKQHLDAIRQRVEYETNLELGTEELTVEEQEQLQGAPTPSAPLAQDRRTDFLSALLPLTRAAEQHVLIQGGIPPEVIFTYDPESKREEDALRSLMDEAKSVLSSKDFEIVLDKALEWAMDVLVDGMAKEVFGEDEEPQQKSVRLAAALPGVTRWSHLAVNALPNEMIDGVANLPEVNALSAIIFASFEDRLRNG